MIYRACQGKNAYSSAGHAKENACSSGHVNREPDISSLRALCDIIYEKEHVADVSLRQMIDSLAGAITYSKRIMLTVGSGIARITQMDGFLVVLSMSLSILIMGKFLGIPVSASQAVVGAVIRFVICAAPLKQWRLMVA